MARTTVGLDIGTSAVRAAEVRGKSPASLQRFAQVGLPPGAIVGGEVVDPETVTHAIRELWKRGGFKAKQVAIAVANQNVVVRQVDVPKMAEADLKGALQFQVQDYIPISIEEAILDYVPLEEYVDDGGAEMLRVLAVAAQRDMVTAFVDVATHAGLDVVSVDIAALAAVRALAEEASSVLAAPEAEGIVDVGGGVTNIAVHDHGSPRFVRILPSGGNDITAALVEAEGLSVEDAESQKMAAGLGPEGAPLPPGAAGVVEQRARIFIDDVRRSIEFYQSQADALPLARVRLLGGGSRLTRLRDRLSAALHLPVEDGGALSQLRIGDTGLSDAQLEQVGVVGAVAVGLAMED